MIKIGGVFRVRFSQGTLVVFSPDSDRAGLCMRYDYLGGSMYDSNYMYFPKPERGLQRCGAPGDNRTPRPYDFRQKSQYHAFTFILRAATSHSPGE